MATDVSEAFQVTVATANNNCRFLTNVQHLEVTGLWQLRSVSRQYPVAIYDLLDFEFVNIRIGVKTLLERMTRLVIRDQIFDG